MGYDVMGWLSKKLLGPGPGGRDHQSGVSGYMKPKGKVTDALDDAGDISAPRRGDTDGDYDTYAEDRNVEQEDYEEK